RVAGGGPRADPAATFTEPLGPRLPAGGTDHGHKGYGKALMIEALTRGLPGYGRAEQPQGWGAGVYIQAIDPAAFGGVDAYLRQTSWIAAACRANPPVPGVAAVRLPGQQGLAARRRALAEGVALYPGIMGKLAGWAAKLEGAVPRPFGG